MSSIWNPTVAWITLRATISRKRALLFAIPAVILIVTTALLKAGRPPDRPWPSILLGTFGFTVLLPLTALIVGTSVLGAEIDDGSVVHLLATPVRRLSVIITKYSVATVLTMIFAAVPELIAALISGGGYTRSQQIVHASANPNTPPDITFIPGHPISDGKFAVGLFVGMLVGAVIYNAIFIMISVATTRAVAVGFLYVLIWEVVLGNFVSGARLLSVSHYSLGVANGFASDPTLNASLTVTTSVIMGAIATAAALYLAVRLLSGFTLKGDPA
jgi:ABC-2 type transport system permease protein